MAVLTCTRLQTTGGELHRAVWATALGAIPVATSTGHGARSPRAPFPTRTCRWNSGHHRPGLPCPDTLGHPHPPPCNIPTHLRQGAPGLGLVLAWPLGSMWGSSREGRLRDGPRGFLGISLGEASKGKSHCAPAWCEVGLARELLASPTRLRTQVPALTLTRAQAAEFSLHVGALALSTPKGSRGCSGRPEAPSDAYIAALAALTPRCPRTPATVHCPCRDGGDVGGNLSQSRPSQDPDFSGASPTLPAHRLRRGF